MSEEKKTRSETTEQTQPKRKTTRKKPENEAETPKNGQNGAKNTRNQTKNEKEEPKLEAPKQEEKLPDPSSVGNQLAMLLLVVSSIFIGICYGFRDEVGVLGHFIGDVFFGLFGLAAFLVPFLLLQLALFWRRDVLSGAVKYKFFVAFFVLLFVSLLCHTVYFAASDIPKMSISEMFSAENLKNNYKIGVEYRGGGFFGGVLAGAFVGAVGYPGAILFGILFLVGFVLSLFGLTPIECIQRYRFYKMRNKTLRAEKNEARKQAQNEAKTVRNEGQTGGKEKENSKNKGFSPRETPSTPPASPRFDPISPDLPSEKKGSRVKNIDGNIFDDNASFGGALSDRAIAKAKAKAQKPISEERLDAGKKGKGTLAGAFAEKPEDDTIILGRIFDQKQDEAVLTRYASDVNVSEAEEDAVTAQMEITLSQPHEATSYMARESIHPDADVPYIPTRKKTAIESAPAEKKAVSAQEILTEKPAAKKQAPSPVSDTIAIRPPEMSVPAPAADAEDGEEEVIVKPREYQFPPIELLAKAPQRSEGDVSAELRENADRIIETLDSFNVRVNISNVSRGPTITRYEVEPAPGTRVRSIINLLDDIALSLATSGVRSDGIISGKSAIGIEVPNKHTNTVFVRELIEDSRFESAKSKLTASLGMDVSGAPVYLDIAKMPHLLIAGATGQGKSVCINSLIISLLYKARPDEVKLILIDPKKVELNVYNGLPHLLVPVVFDPKKAAGSLHWAVQEMERRFELIEAMHVRNIAQYNAAVAGDPLKETLPQVVIIIDELADLMMSAPDDVETSICRLAQKARAAGMHLIIGTQRPSTDVITGLIKANIPSRIAFTVSNQIDSRIIIDTQGAEKLIGRGDMLFSPVGSSKPVRVQGSFVSETEIENIIEFIKSQSTEASYSDDIIKEIEKNAAVCGQKKGKGASPAMSAAEGEMADGEEADPMLDAAIELAVDSGKISTSLIQRRLSLGYGRAAKLIDVMEKRGIVSPPEGQKPRNVLITREMYLEMRMNAEDAEGGMDEPPFDL